MRRVATEGEGWFFCASPCARGWYKRATGLEGEHTGEDFRKFGRDVFQGLLGHPLDDRSFFLSAVHHSATSSVYMDRGSGVVGAFGKTSGSGVSARLNSKSDKMLPCGTLLWLYAIREQSFLFGRNTSMYTPTHMAAVQCVLNGRVGHVVKCL